MKTLLLLRDAVTAARYALALGRGLALLAALLALPRPFLGLVALFLDPAGFLTALLG